MERQVYERIDALADRHWWFLSRRRILEAAIGRLTGGARGLRLLEAGCGPGNNLSMLAKFGTVSAFEPDQAACQQAASRHGGEVRRGGLPDAVPFSPESFDIALMLDVLEHVEDDAAALNAVTSMLAPGGLLIVTVPAYGWLWSRHDERHHHYRRYTLSALRRLAAGANIDIVVASYFNTLLLPLIVGARLIGGVFGRQGDDDALPPPLLNALLGGVFGLERHLLGRVHLPAGVSIFLAARRRAP